MDGINVNALIFNNTDKVLVHEARYKSIAVHFQYQFPDKKTWLKKKNSIKNKNNAFVKNKANYYY